MLPYDHSLSDIDCQSRCLYALALEHHAPRFFADYTWGGVPYLALLFAALLGLLAFLSLPSVADELEVLNSK